MTNDYRAGTTVLAADFPATVLMGDSTTISNITSTTYITGSPVVSGTFMAPTSGRVRLITSFTGGSDASGNRVFVTPKIYKGTDATGAVVVQPSTRYAVGSMSEQTSSSAYERCTMLTGLDGGATYFAQVLYRVTGGTTIDLLYRGLIIVPCS